MMSPYLSELLGAFLNIMVNKKKIHYSCEDGMEKSVPHDHRLLSLGKPRDDKR